MGSVVGMTDASGTVVATYAYDPWGNPTGTTGTGIAARNPLRYRAYYLDAETGLAYMPARYYDPATYRFLSADPAAPSAGDPGSLNAFAYCGDDPVNAVDPGGDRIIEEAEAWSHYYQKFNQDRRAATQATKQAHWVCRGMKRRNTLKVILYGKMFPGDEEADRWEHVAFGTAAGEPGDVLVLSGESHQSWVDALTKFGCISELMYIGHSANAGRDLALSPTGDPSRFNTVLVERLPTDHMLDFGKITLWTCEAAEEGGVLYQFSRHFGVHTIGNVNVMVPMEDGTCRPGRFPGCWLNDGWVDVDLGF